MNNKLRIRKGDTVVVLTGKYKGIKGKVLKVFPKTRRVIVERVNLIKKSTRPSQQNQQGGIIEKEAPIDVSNVMLWNSKINSVTKAVFRVVGDRRVRVCHKSGDEI
ncbi:MAG: 50S ribosomal protein L24 [Candidatus Cloacimonadales bacterium]|jgi:large subunit ribosomal protein L24|nr:50S ribosomal protein L24 [Candidatus Cloacimonadota bacterium]MDD3501288.1 50S ribosomal protein L24 [Candidatus Cloacimonadota bacterium]MDX9977384.1 50S ribosomal protein L24 [Candidatus Cloacimonadales bacterium]